MNFEDEKCDSLEPLWNLRTIAITAIVTSLWKRLNFYSLDGWDDDLKRKRVLELIYQELFRIINSEHRMVLHTAQFKALKEMVVQTTPDIYDWFQYCHKKMNKYRCKKLLWTPNGMLDVERMVQEWFRDPHEIFARELRFQLACDFCLENKVQIMYTNISEEVLDRLADNDDGFSLLEYWIKRLDNDSPLPEDHPDRCCMLEIEALLKVTSYRSPIWQNGVANVPRIKYLAKRMLDRNCARHGKKFFVDHFSAYLQRAVDHILKLGPDENITVITSSLMYFLSQVIYKAQWADLQGRYRELEGIMFAIFFNRLWQPKMIFWSCIEHFQFGSTVDLQLFVFMVSYQHHIKNFERYVDPTVDFDDQNNWTRYSRIMCDLYTQFPMLHKSALSGDEASLMCYLTDAFKTERKRAGRSATRLHLLPRF